MAFVYHSDSRHFSNRDTGRARERYHGAQRNPEGLEMSAAPTKRVAVLSIIATLAIGVPYGLSTIDRSPPLVYQGGWYESIPAAGEKAGTRITEARPGDTVVLALKIQWPRTNCSTELERRFIAGDPPAVYKVPLAAGEPARLGPPPKSILAPDGTLVSRRRVTLPSELPEGTATHSPDIWQRCTAPAEKWGDYLTEIWPIFIGPKGADATINIRR